MEKITVDLYTEPTNNAVMRVPGRQYPGVLVQGDSLRTFYLAADSIWQLAVKHGNDALIDEALDLRESIAEILGNYEKVLSDNEIPLPYPT